MKTTLQRIPRIIYNDDSDLLRQIPPPHTVASVACAVDYLKGTQVDCLCWCVGAQLAYSWPSKAIESLYERQAKGGSFYDDFLPPTNDLMYHLHRRGIDYLPLLIQRAHAQGLMLAASFRMNDTHHKSDPRGLLAPEFWKTHQAYRLWDATDGKSYYNAALDYSFPEVRKRYRDGIGEVAGRYDVDGIELDFTRSPYFFQPSEAWRKRGILTDFVQQIREDLEGIGSRSKRSLVLILRIPCAERALTTAGIDAQRWIEKRLAPILVVSELVIQCNQSLEPWRSLCRKHGVRFYPSLEVAPAFMNANFYSPIHNPFIPSHGFGVRAGLDEHARMQRAAAQNLLAQRPDGIYMFNFPCLFTGRNIMFKDQPAFRRLTSVLREVGSLRTLARKDKRYTFYRDLPIYVEANRPRRFHQTLRFAIRGKDIRTARVTLRFRQIAERNPHSTGKYRQHPIVKSGILKYHLNDREISERELKRIRAPAGRIPSGFRLRAHEIVELRVTGRELRDGENTLAFEMPHFPEKRDPYVYIYELEAEARFAE